MKVGGYGQIGQGGRGGRMLLTHRVAFALHIERELTSDEVVCHRCDNPPCCNVAHMFLGDHLANVIDMRSKGRERHKGGSDHGMSKLTEGDIAAIRAAYTGKWGQQTALAREYGVSQTTIFDIVNRKLWTHV